MMRKKYEDKFWNFNKSNTKEYTHGYHTYPAMMIPQIARELIKKYKTDDHKVLFDPYTGSGTSLVEGTLAGFKCCKGTDLNPLARLISETKTLEIDLKKLELFIKKYSESISIKILKFEEIKEFNIPKFQIINTWFKKRNLEELSLIKDYIDSIDDKNIKNFFLVSFTETVRKVSLTRDGEFKLYRIHESKRDDFNPCTFDIFYSRLLKNKEHLQDYIGELKEKKITDQEVKIYDFNTVYEIPSDVIDDESIDFVLTSPPYGDSSTTVAYGQFSRLANEWLGYKEAAKIDSRLINKGRIGPITYELARLYNKQYT
jgi:DNA modification methylase